MCFTYTCVCITGAPGTFLNVFTVLFIYIFGDRVSQNLELKDSARVSDLQALGDSQVSATPQHMLL